MDRYHGDYKVQSFSCLDQFLSLAFAQLTYRESLRDIETCLRAHQSQLYHMGFGGTLSRNTRYRRCAQRWVDHSTGLRSDQTIRLTGPKSSRRYPTPLRRIHYFDPEKDLRLMAILKKQLGLDQSVHETLQVLSITIFEKTPISLAFTHYDDRILKPDPCIQLDLFNL